MSKHALITGITGQDGSDEIYNLGAQSQVHISFEMPEYTGDTTGLEATRILEAVREDQSIAGPNDLVGRVEQVLSRMPKPGEDSEGHSYGWVPVGDSYMLEANFSDGGL